MNFKLKHAHSVQKYPFFWAHFELKDRFLANLSFKSNILNNVKKGGKFEYIWKLGFKKRDIFEHYDAICDL